MRLLLVVFAVIGIPNSVLAKANTACDLAAEMAAQQSSVPLRILLGIARAESGRMVESKLIAWPWTLNLQGKGVWFENRTVALNTARDALSKGIMSVDIGCFQINYRWHSNAFDTLEDMFDPNINALYAAHFLSELFDEFGDWSAAISAYHSRTPDLGRKYLRIFNRIASNIDRDNAHTTHPLIAMQSAPMLASLVPAHRNGQKVLMNSLWIGE